MLRYVQAEEKPKLYIPLESRSILPRRNIGIISELAKYALLGRLVLLKEGRNIE